MIRAVVMAGGSGSRLWPMSRVGYPKQFLALGESGDTMLQATMKRVKALGISSTVTICNEDHRFFVADQLNEIGMLDSIILEPEGKNTAPAIALAAIQAADDPLLLVLAADHIIEDLKAFENAVRSATALAEAGNLVTFGIVPKDPNTGYGYIKRGRKKSVGFNVSSFREKPSLDVAQEYCASNEYYWNSGMFLFKASRYLEELEKFCPDIYKACQESVEMAEADMDFLRVNKVAFSGCPSVSVDYAVMEKTSDAVMVPMDAGWSDIGSWTSLWDVSKKDGNGNAGDADTITHNTNDCYIRSDNKLVAAVGLKNVIIVDTKDALLVAHKDSVQDIKIIAQQLKANARTELEFHREVYRPWGKYDSIDSGDRYQVKRITVKPGAKLSVQMHHHRAEHWIVVSGAARVKNGDKTFLLSENESTYIPIGVVHSLENPGKKDLELIEVQSGGYLGEDDIVRFKDKYGRVE